LRIEQRSPILSIALVELLAFKSFNLSHLPEGSAVPYSPIKVANEFLRIASSETPARGLTPLALLKLVYIAHGWSMIHLNQPLLSEQPQAWQYGPVVPSLYHAIKQFGASAVMYPIPGDTDPQVLSPEAAGLIQAVYKAYGHLSGVQLSNMTHQPDTPWSRAWTTAGKNALISNNEIQEHYRRLSTRAA
jgi:uncharacterized phage-associated protein